MTEIPTELCPHCEGTGRRVVPPPAQPHGGQRGGAGRSHGYVATYMAGCRCTLCRAARRAYAQKRKQAAS